MSQALSTSSPQAPDSGDRGIGGHPTGLYILFATEMWERFSYYGMRALLVLYLVKQVKMERADALSLYGTYAGLVYLTPMFGGWIADQYLGQRKAILIGGTTMALGHFAMAFEPLLNLALGLLIIGNGFFKPNISTLVGTLYAPNDIRKDSAYTIFYMGINLGAFFSPIICGTLGEKVAWHLGFGAAGVGMVAGLITFILFQDKLGPGGFPPGRADADEPAGPAAYPVGSAIPQPRAAGGPPRLTYRDWVDVAAISAAAVPFVYAMIWLGPKLGEHVWSRPEFVGGPWIMLWGFRLAVLALLIGAILLASEQMADPNALKPEPLTRHDWHRILVIIVVATFGIVFWTGFEQAGGTMNLFADEKTELKLFGFNFPASWFQSVNPLFVVLLAPLFSWIWSATDSTRFAVPTVAKQAIGMIILGLGFVLMAAAEEHSAELGADTGAKFAKVSIFWLLGVYFIHTMGELCLSPIGLSLVNKLSPARVASLMMAVWFLSSSIAGKLAGVLEEILADYEKTHNVQIPLWDFLIWTCIGMGVVLLALTPLLKKMMHRRG